MLWNTKSEVCVKTEGLVFHSTPRAIRLTNSLIYSKNENIPKIYREFSEFFSQDLSIIIFPRISVDYKIFRKLFENSSRVSRKITSHEFCQKHFPEFYHSPNFSGNFERILVHIRFQFCSAAESIGQDGTQPIRLQESRAG